MHFNNLIVVILNYRMHNVKYPTCGGYWLMRVGSAPQVSHCHQGDAITTVDGRLLAYEGWLCSPG